MNPDDEYDIGEAMRAKIERGDELFDYKRDEALIAAGDRASYRQCNGAGKPTDYPGCEQFTDNPPVPWFIGVERHELAWCDACIRTDAARAAAHG